MPPKKSTAQMQEQIGSHRERDRICNAAARWAETAEQPQLRPQRNRTATAAARSAETAEQTQLRLQRNRIAAARRAETAEQTQVHREQARIDAAAAKNADCWADPAATQTAQSSRYIGQACKNLRADAAAVTRTWCTSYNSCSACWIFRADEMATTARCTNYSSCYQAPCMGRKLCTWLQFCNTV